MSNELVIELPLSDGICPCCEEEITVSVVAASQVELECRCGCSLAVA